MRSRAIFWIVVAFAGTIVLAVAGTILLSRLGEEGPLGILEAIDDDLVAYLAVFGLVFADAIVPIFPGETTLNSASVLASQGELELELVIVAGAVGAILGDSCLYWIARTGPKGLKARLEGASKKDARVERALGVLGQSGPLLITMGRFVPGVRFVVNVSMGVIEYPYPRFLLFSTIGGVAWSAYTCLLAYRVGSTLEDYPLASIVVSGLVTTILIAGVYWVDRRRRGGEEAASTGPMETETR